MDGRSLQKVKLAGDTGFVCTSEEIRFGDSEHLELLGTSLSTLNEINPAPKTSDCRLTKGSDLQIITPFHLQWQGYAPTHLPTYTGRMPYTTSGTRRAGIDVAMWQRQFCGIVLSPRQR